MILIVTYETVTGSFIRMHGNSEACTKKGDSNAKKVLYYQAENPVFNYAASYNVGTILQNELWPAILGGKSAKQAVDTYASKIQKQITSVYNGTLVN